MRSPARERLARAQERLVAAREALAKADEVHTAGEAFAAEARAVLASLSEHEAAAGAEVAEAIRAALAEGRPPPDAVEPASGLERATAQATLDGREAAAQLLAQDLASARAGEAGAAQEVRLAVRGVLIEDAAAAAAEGLAALEVVRRSYRRAMLADRVGHAPALGGPLSITSETVAFLRGSPPPDDLAGQVAAAVGLWHGYKAALEHDPDASCPDGTLPEMPRNFPGQKPGPVAFVVSGPPAEGAA